MVNLGGLIGLREMGAVYLSVILLVYVVIRGWNVYNKIRYGGRNKRVGKKIITHEEVDRFFSFPANGTATIQSMTNMDVDFTEDHKIAVREGEVAGKAVEGKFRPT